MGDDSNNAGMFFYSPVVCVFNKDSAMERTGTDFVELPCFSKYISNVRCAHLLTAGDKSK